MIGGPVKSVLAKVAVTVGAGIATILSTARMAFAAGTGMSLSPEYNEILRLAQQKVLAATQPGAFGNGVPMLYGDEPMMQLPWIGIALSAAIAVICAAKLLAPRVRDDALLAH